MKSPTVRLKCEWKQCGRVFEADRVSAATRRYCSHSCAARANAYKRLTSPGRPSPRAKGADAPARSKAAAPKPAAGIDAKLRRAVERAVETSMSQLPGTQGQKAARALPFRGVPPAVVQLKCQWRPCGRRFMAERAAAGVRLYCSHSCAARANAEKRLNQLRGRPGIIDARMRRKVERAIEASLTREPRPRPMKPLGGGVIDTRTRLAVERAIVQNALQIKSAAREPVPPTGIDEAIRRRVRRAVEASMKALSDD